MDADYTMNVTRASGVYIQMFSNTKLFLSTHNIIENFKEIETEIFGVHFVSQPSKPVAFLDINKYTRKPPKPQNDTPKNRKKKKQYSSDSAAFF